MKHLGTLARSVLLYVAECVEELHSVALKKQTSVLGKECISYIFVMVWKNRHKMSIKVALCLSSLRNAAMFRNRKD